MIAFSPIQQKSPKTKRKKKEKTRRRRSRELQVQIFDALANVFPNGTRAVNFIRPNPFGPHPRGSGPKKVYQAKKLTPKKAHMAKRPQKAPVG